MVDKKQSGVPTTIVVFGATGDLNKRKLIPAFLDLFVRGLLPENFSIVGFSRKELSHDAYREFIKDVVREKGHTHTEEQLNAFLEKTYYIQGDFTDARVYQRISEFLYERDNTLGICSNKLFYLAVPPDFYDTIFQNLADSGLSIPCNDESGWTRIVVEKPFGKDLETAQALDKKLSLLFKENQIFRIDHYLAKETLANIIAFRFSNSIFEPTWNNKYIEKIHIRLFEDIGVEGRVSFYDGVGALRDVGQNHTLQMLSLLVMKDPGELNAEKIRAAREGVVGALIPLSKEECTTKTKKMQYESFKKEEGITPDSKTETYFRIEATLGSDTWKGVPIILEGGKKLSKKKTDITVYFKEKTTCVCEVGKHTEAHKNILRFLIQPEEGIQIRFWAKKPGFKMELESQELSFKYGNGNGKSAPDAYEKLLLHVLEGDQTLFASSKEVESSWRFVTPILEYWQDKEPEIYKDNTNIDSPIV